MKVYYSGSFWGGHLQQEHSGREIPINKKFLWGGLQWQIPSVYSCSKGLVIDFCVGIPRERIEKFYEHWNTDTRIFEMSEEDIEQMEKENPFRTQFTVEAKINGKELQYHEMSSVSWHPCDIGREQIGDVQEELMKYYACDKDQGWSFIRVHFPWKTVRKPKLRTLSLKLKEAPVACIGEQFITDQAFQSQVIQLIHPLSKKEYQLTIDGCEATSLDADAFRFRNDLEYPGYFHVLAYHISPELSFEEFRIQDRARSDRPRSRGCDSAISNRTSVGSMAVIGGCDGPTAIFVAGRQVSNQHTITVSSSLHFTPISKVEWQPVFYVKENEDIVLEIHFS